VARLCIDQRLAVDGGVARDLDVRRRVLAVVLDGHAVDAVLGVAVPDVGVAGAVLDLDAAPVRGIDRPDVLDGGVPEVGSLDATAVAARPVDPNVPDGDVRDGAAIDVDGVVFDPGGTHRGVDDSQAVPAHVFDVTVHDSNVRRAGDEDAVRLAVPGLVVAVSVEGELREGHAVGADLDQVLVGPAGQPEVRAPQGHAGRGDHEWLLDRVPDLRIEGDSLAGRGGVESVLGVSTPGFDDHGRPHFANPEYAVGSPPILGFRYWSSRSANL
jgi:hypothetical protein